MTPTTVRRFLICLVIILPLQGCLSSVFTGAGFFYDRHTLKRKIQNINLDSEAQARFKRDPSMDSRHNRLQSTTFNGVMLLTGEVPDKETRTKAAEIVSEISGVKRVINKIEIGPPSSTKEIWQDSWIAMRIRAKLIADDRIDPSKIKVVVEQAVVYYLGSVTPKQADLAVSAAMDTSGVHHVIRAFEYITYSSEYPG